MTNRLIPLNITHIPYFRGWTWGTPTVPNLYWDVYSQEERWKKICLGLGKLQAYLDQVVNLTVNEVIDLVNDLAAEVEDLSDELAAEIQNRIDAIQAEQDAREAKDEDLQNQIDGLTLTLTGDISYLTSLINNESTRAQAREDYLQSSIEQCEELCENRAITDVLWDAPLPNGSADLNFKNAAGTLLTSVNLPVATSTNSGIITKELFSNVQTLLGLRTFRGAFNDTVPTSSSDPAYHGVLPVQDGDYVYRTDTTNNIVWLAYLNVTGTTVTSSDVLQVESPTAPPTFDNDSIITNSSGDWSVNKDLVVNTTEPTMTNINSLAALYVKTTGGAAQQVLWSDVVTWLEANLVVPSATVDIVGAVRYMNVRKTPAEMLAAYPVEAGHIWALQNEGRAQVSTLSSDATLATPGLTVGSTNPLSNHNHTQNPHKHNIYDLNGWAETNAQGGINLAVINNGSGPSTGANDDPIGRFPGSGIAIQDNTATNIATGDNTNHANWQNSITVDKWIVI